MQAEIGTNIQHAVELLQKEQLVAIPTETVYGLAGNALSSTAVTHIFKAKNRPSFDPLIVHTSSIDRIANFAFFESERLQKLAKAFCPGPITFILPKKTNVPDLVTSGHPTVGVRIPNHPITLKLLEQLDFPVAAPSANPFGFTSPTSAQHVANQLGNQIPYILDGGSANVGVESTIVEDTPNGLQVLRLGGLSIEDIEKCIEEPVVSIKTSSSTPHAPGMLSSHYNPGTPVQLIQSPLEAEAYSSKKIGYIAFSQNPNLSFIENVAILSASGSTTEAAQHLFATLRAFGQLNLDLILVEPAPDKGLGTAINDRLKRASATRKTEET